MRVELLRVVHQDRDVSLGRLLDVSGQSLVVLPVVAALQVEGDRLDLGVWGCSLA